ncbi:BREX-1 system phosphatase PglZ type A [Levilactobacillus namurensis]|uniref:BREX-1 system phosphatase PglZ type A n=1 Tax=Levilactobacillus namurensis TaxID=380393 RepID=A0AAW8W3N6_9LACO|nr:BREX-1 system phosphatase PglZ type A [Levilactobacillus namurensis]MDT7013343.1 BREX-1 system phosphatase PglZ type A [Levilactobacillus namurensis]
MADVDTEKIIETLKQRFNETHQFIFWYDEHGEFRDQVNDIQAGLQGVAQVWVLTRGHQVQVKRELLALAPSERVLIYSPEPEPSLNEDHLRNIVLYSGTFTADSLEILRKALGYPQSLRPFLKDHRKFFDSKERRQRLRHYDLKSYLVTPELAIMAVVAKLKQPLVDFFDILQLVLGAGMQDNLILAGFEKYQVSGRFWDEVRSRFGYTAATPNLSDFIVGLYLTITYHQMKRPMPQRFANLDFSQDLANVQTLMQQFGSRHQDNTTDMFGQLAHDVWQAVQGATLFADADIDAVARADSFPQFDEQLLLWVQERLQLGDVNAQLNGRSIDQVTKWRVDTTHYGQQFKSLYQMMRKAWHLVRDVRVQAPTNQATLEAIENYVQSGYRLDTRYRQFVWDYQRSQLPDAYRPTKQLVDALYVNDYLAPSMTTWNQNLNLTTIPATHQQRNFYKNHIAPETNRIVVIISDAFRFEAAKELEKQLRKSDQVTGLKMDYLVTGLPSVTYMGMPAMLPHHDLTLEEKTLLVDGQPAVNREQRQRILQAQNPASAAYALDDLKDAPSAEIREKFAGKQVVYIYHNQIDTTADNLKSEDSTFQATAEAISEIRLLIGRLRTVSIAHILVTADHGYIYRDDQLEDSDKIDLQRTGTDIKSQRYLITDRNFTLPGVDRQSLGQILGRADDRYVYYPQTAKTFRAPGGANYVHGGSSLQEMVVPLLDVRTTTSRSEAHNAQLEVVNATKRITSLEVPVVLRQSEPVGATVIPTAYNLYFVDDQGRHISGLVTVNANSQSIEVEQRIQQTTIVLADRYYDKTKDYYLIIENKQEPTDYQRIAFDMDIANLDDFDF